jgi:hypothetical protein
MAWLEIDYKTAKKRYPNEVQEVIKKVRSGKSKNKNTDPELWAWGFSWSIQIGGINGGDFAKMIAGQMDFPKAAEPKTADEEVADEAGRSIVYLAAKVGNARCSSNTRIDYPDEIANQVRESIEKRNAEKARFNALSPGEQARETNDLLRQLSRSPGFVALGVPRVTKLVGTDIPYSEDVFDRLQNSSSKKVSGLLSRIQDLTAEKPAPADKKPKRAAGKGNKNGKVKYYWQYDENNEDNDGPIFMITPKDYFDEAGALDDSFDSDEEMPEGFSNLSESYFEFNGSREEAEKALRANPIFEERAMF